MFKGLCFLLALLLPSCFKSRTFSLFLGGMFPHLSFHTCRYTIAGAPDASQSLAEGSPTHVCGATCKESCLWTPGPLNPLPSFNLVLLLYHLSLHSSISYKGRTGAALKKKNLQEVFKSDIDFLRFITASLSLNLHHLHKLNWLDILLY